MTRYEAKQAVYEIINSGILDMSLEGDLVELVNCLCEDSFDPCPEECLRYCKLDECPHVKEDGTEE